MQQKQNGSLEAFLRASFDDYVRSVECEAAHTVQLPAGSVPGCAVKAAEAVQKRREEQAALALKAAEESEERQQHWEKKREKSRVRLRKKQRETEMRPRTEYGYETGFDHPAKAAAARQREAQRENDTTETLSQRESRAREDASEGGGRDRREAAAVGALAALDGRQQLHGDYDRTLSFASPIKPTASAESALGYQGRASERQRGAETESETESERDPVARAGEWLDQSRHLDVYDDAQQ